MRRTALSLLALMLAAPSGASAATATLTYFSAAHTIAGYEALQQVELPVASPPSAGFVMGLEADVVGTPTADAPALSIRKVMLHHIVFSKLGATDATCHNGVQRFFAEGEEHTRLALPSGYGYPNAAGATWVMLWMLMNHARAAETVYVRYRVTYVTGELLTPVTPVWLDANNCQVDPIYDVTGVGKARTSTRTSTVTLLEGGRIVGAGGHLHGGGIELRVRDLDCAGAVLYRSRPTWGAAGHPYYTVRPILHEPGPIDMGAFTSETGIPVATGHRIALDSIYDNTRPHARVMGITIMYVAPDRTVTGCPTPADDLTWTTPPAGRTTAPAFPVPLFFQPSDPYRRTTSTTSPDRSFLPDRVSITQGQTMHWHLSPASGQHTVTWASGPRGAAAFSSAPFGLTPDTVDLAHRFTVPGTYRFYCSLHPATMVQVVRVVARPRRR